MDLHSMYTMGLLEQKGQSRNTYYIAGPRYEEISRGDGEISRDSEEISRGDGEISRDSEEISKGDGEISRAFPEELIGKCKRLKNGNPRTR